MAITVSNVQENHRSLYWEYTGDGATKISSASLPLHLHPNSTGVATVTTSPAVGNGVKAYGVVVYDQYAD